MWHQIVWDRKRIQGKIDRGLKASVENHRRRAHPPQASKPTYVTGLTMMKET
jgi:hypothetical protein